MIPLALQRNAAEIWDCIRSLLPEKTDALSSAMHYAVLDSGKALRPFLTMQSAALFSVEKSFALRTAAAIELLHAYSLAHDDLPAMDGSTTRRGKPSLHQAFGESTAILAGNALLTLAFSVLSQEATHPDAAVRCRLIEGLSQAGGHTGLLGGQFLDLKMEGSQPDIEAVLSMVQRKTGALLAFSCVAGGILADAPEPQIRALENFGNDFGKAYQIIDDWLDATGDEKMLGKPTQQDSEKGKASFASLLSSDACLSRAKETIECACTHLTLFGERAHMLHEVSSWMLQRQA